MTPLSKCDIHAQQAQEEAEAGGGVAHMAGVEVEVCRYAVEGEVVLLRRDLPDLRALEVDVGDYTANEAELDNAKAAKKETGWEESPECGWCHGLQIMIMIGVSKSGRKELILTSSVLGIEET
jgi:hypothetical protein